MLHARVNSHVSYPFKGEHLSCPYLSTRRLADPVYPVAPERPAHSPGQWAWPDRDGPDQCPAPWSRHCTGPNETLLTQRETSQRYRETYLAEVQSGGRGSVIGPKWGGVGGWGGGLRDGRVGIQGGNTGRGPGYRAVIQGEGRDTGR